MRVLNLTDHYFLNHGDTAMLQVAVGRFREMWPGVHIQTLTDYRERLAIHCPGVEAIPERGRLLWWQEQLFGEGMFQRLPRVCRKCLNGTTDLARRSFPAIMLRLLHVRLRKRAGDSKAVDAFLRAMRAADVVAVSGMGGITDVWKTYAIKQLRTLILAQNLRKPTIMLGQGIGPIKNPEVFCWARRALPRMTLIALREGRAALPLLEACGVARDRVRVTGDDAIELAYAARPQSIGRGIGINLRVAPYSAVNQTETEAVCRILHEFARAHSASLLPAPILFGERDSDPQAIRELLAGYDDASDGGERLQLPADTISQVARCRIVITGSYHAGVFALSQGVPVVSIAKSAYYVDKFLGLASQFGCGCAVVRPDRPGFHDDFKAALHSSWEQADVLRPKLLNAASTQVEASRDAYRRVHDLTWEWTSERKGS